MGQYVRRSLLLWLGIGLLVLLGCDLNKDSGTTGDADTLVITEVGSTEYTNSSCWIEIYNRSQASVSLSDYTLRSPARLRDDPYTYSDTIVFDLPSLSIPPGSYAIIRGKNYDDYETSSRVAYLVNTNNQIPWWGTSGFIELRYGSQVSDFVRFGDSAIAPSQTAAWNGLNAPYLTIASGNAIARNSDNSDSDSGDDWTYRDIATFGGPNDVTDLTDDDNDGIPDANEQAGTTFAGLPLNDWGAAPGQTDIFIHINYMDSTDPGVTPAKEAMQKVVDVFASNGYAMHIDTGNLFTGSVDPANFNLSGESHQIPYSDGIALGVEIGKANLYELKYRYMPLARKQVFHYCIFANSLYASGSAGPSGLGELRGNDFIVSLGGWGLNTSTTENSNQLTNYQAATFMHELGHNLGLYHGGDENENYKPNYVSIMNYLYQLKGLPDVGSSTEGDRYYHEYDMSGYTSLNDLTNSPLGNPSNFILDYSDEIGADLDENAVDESMGLYQGAYSDVDYDGDGTSPEAVYSMDVNTAYSESVSGQQLSGHNDWANIDLFFTRTYSGDTSGIVRSVEDDSESLMDDPVWNDKQMAYPEPPLRNIERYFNKGR